MLTLNPEPAASAMYGVVDICRELDIWPSQSLQKTRIHEAAHVQKGIGHCLITQLNELITSINHLQFSGDNPAVNFN